MENIIINNPKYKIGDEIKLVGIIKDIKCYSLHRGWQYQIFIEGCTLEDMQMNNYPNIVERGINLDKIPEKI